MYGSFWTSNKWEEPVIEVQGIQKNFLSQNHNIYFQEKKNLIVLTFEQSVNAKNSYNDPEICGKILANE